MNDPEQSPTDAPLADMFDATRRDAPEADPAFLNELRERTLAAFAAAAPVPATPSPSPREQNMVVLRWIAATAAAVLVIGLATAYWIATQKPAPAPAPEENKFVVQKDLADDGRIGKVTDAQGVVAVKPVLAERWSPVQSGLVLKPGDWVRTDARGGNAAALKLFKSAQLIVGPHSTVELLKADEIRLIDGELEVTATEAAAVELTGPDKQKVAVKGKQFFRVEKEKLVRVEKEPRWLQGFKGTTTNESVGALIAKVDGRDVPLTVGYHHVTVDIRDQIARTTIEESFVNTTPNVLEGVFHFPLPQDASISGFGMWIGDQLVEADVVEKQRAREIYEEILREKRDPGLLEWAGGNIFKARVFPIPGRSEKRIKITYTQVLPLQGNRFRYSYALQSELLKQHPLRDLKIDVKVNSAVALKSVSSPTHLVRVATTEHSGHAEFSAQEYTPTRDFEAVCEVEPGRPDVVVVPHRRGDDGYFMVQLTPPGAAADWERPLVPNGTPLRLLIVADTSASMDRSQRANQAAVLSALLGALTPKDTVNVAACDVNCDWVFEKPVPATPANVATATEVLAKRSSLGWTDLDKAFASALKMTEPGTHVVYLGDAVSTTGTADPVAFAKRLQKLAEGKPGTFHAVALGSSYEPAVLNAIGRLGSGSVRRVSADRTPQATALDLLTEIAAPSLLDLKVEFTGLRTARVYPEVLPNVPAGTQQILLGRYLPEGKDQTGEIIVTGTLGGKPVRYTTKVSLKDAEAGNSFVPRLWARMHLDKLLEQGRTESVKQDVIALSEEFHIITPYTSLLVLESDADRARYGVKRRFQMRDGEKFFAQGNDNATFELKQKQMKLAGAYRTALRRSVLAQLQSLGRDADWFRRHPREIDQLRLLALNDAESLGEVFFDVGLSSSIAATNDSILMFDGAPVVLSPLVSDRGSAEYVFDRPALQFDPKPHGRTEWEESDGTALGQQLQRFRRVDADGPDLPNGDFGLSDPDYLSDLTTLAEGRINEFGLDKAKFAFAEQPTGATPGRRRASDRQLRWLGTLFPLLAPAARAPKEPKTLWPAPALALARSVLRTDKLTRLKGGVVITRQSDNFSPASGQPTTRSASVELVSPGAWFARTAPEGGQITVSWCDAKECGVFGTGFQLGRVRVSTKEDLKYPPLGLSDHSLSALHRDYAHMTPAVETLAKDRALLILKYKDNPDYEIRVLIDTERHVVLSVETRNKNKVAGQTRFTDFVEVAGQWWAQRVETLDEKDRRVALTSQTVTEVPAADFTKRLDQELAGRSNVLFLKQPLPSVDNAKQRAAEDKATFDDRAVLTLHFAATQQWERALEHFQRLEKGAAGKTGVRWLRDSFLLASRRHEELRKRLLAEAAALVATNDPDAKANDYFLAEHLNSYGASVLQTDERLALDDQLRKIYERQPAHLGAMKNWRTRRAALLEQSGQIDKARALAREIATEYPRDHSAQYRYAQALANGGDFAAAYAWLDRVLAAGTKWDHEYHETSLRDLYVNLLQQQGRARDLADFLAAWVTRNPESESPYSQYLTALVRSNQAARAEALAAQWMRDARIEGELAPAVVARLRAAVNFALGRGSNLHTDRVEKRWHVLLVELVRFFSTRDDQLNLVSNILHSSRFASTDEARALRKELAERFVKDVDTLSLTRIESLMDWVWVHDGTEKDAWKKVAASLRKRWDTEKDSGTKHRIGELLVRVLSWLDEEESLKFRRQQLADASAEYRSGYAHRLFEALLGRGWTPALEDELFGLIDKLPTPDEPAGGLLTKVATLHRLTDTLPESRFRALMAVVEKPGLLPHTELLKKQGEARKAARTAFADRLRKEAAKHPKPFANWITAERVWLDIQLDRDLKSAADDGWAVLAVPAAKPDPDAPGSALTAHLDELLRARAFAVLENLAARTGADPALVGRLVAFVDQQIKDHPEDARWRAEKYRLLIALDRVKELESELVRWTTGPNVENRWRLALGYLLAEQGRVPDAIKQFETVERADELSPAAHRRLAEWYLIENRRADSERATLAVFKTTGEYQLNNRLNQYLSPWRSSSGPLPTKLDPEVFQIFAALFEKAPSPQNYLWHLQQFYAASRDFRLLSMLPDGVVGHTAAKVYPFLRGMGGVLAEVRDEATADELAQRLQEVRKRAKTPVDQRALDLLELSVERRAAELQNQPGPHAGRALAALVRAFKHEWSPGEPRLMAEFLADLGAVPQPALAKEQLRQLEQLHRGAEKGSFDRLHIADRRAQTLHAHAQRGDATDLLQSALTEFEDANNGVLPTSANSALRALVSFHAAARHYDMAEKVLSAQLKHPVHAEQKRWLTQLLSEQYQQALIHNGSVALGEGAALYRALEAKLFAELGDPDQNHRYASFQQLARLYRTAHDLKFATAPGDLKAFAFTQLPKLLREQTVNFESVVRDFSQALHALIGPRDALTFVLDRADDEPDWLRYTNQDAWTQHHYRLGQWRHELKDLGDLAPRLLKLVLTELRRDLRSREARSRDIYDRRHDYFWAEKTADFAKIAEEVLAEQKGSGTAAVYIAEYLFKGLPRETRAIDVLLAAYEQKLLNESGRWQLADYLHRQDRFAESVPVLVALVAEWPDRIAYRTKLMHAYFRTGNAADLLALLKATDAFFHEKDRWSEDVLAALGYSCLENRLFEQAVAYYKELIPKRQRGTARRGTGDGTLSGYYTYAARAYAGLGKTQDAVDMASGAVVTWGPHLEPRKQALAVLLEVLASAPDLAGYLAWLDKEPLQSAVIRKAVGKAFIQKNDHARALSHLHLAAELQPDDAETYELLLVCFDKIGDQAGATKQLLAAVEVSRRDIKLFEQLGRRYALLNKPAEAERAYTSVVEALPNESEGHALLAEVREKQGRWADAIAHWERVAEIRSLEPTGLLKLGAAQVEAKEYGAAAQTLKKLRGRTWPPRFDEVEKHTRELEQKLEDRSKK